MTRDSRPYLRIAVGRRYRRLRRHEFEPSLRLRRHLKRLRKCRSFNRTVGRIRRRKSRARAGPVHDPSSLAIVLRCHLGDDHFAPRCPNSACPRLRVEPGAQHQVKRPGGPADLQGLRSTFSPSRSGTAPGCQTESVENLFVGSLAVEAFRRQPVSRSPGRPSLSQYVDGDLPLGREPIFPLRRPGSALRVGGGSSTSFSATVSPLVFRQNPGASPFFGSCRRGSSSSTWSVRRHRTSWLTARNPGRSCHPCRGALRREQFGRGIASIDSIHAYRPRRGAVISALGELQAGLLAGPGRRRVSLGLRQS